MKDLKSLFLRNEIKKLLKHNRNQLMVLCLVFTLLIIALNQSIFGLQNINERYSNPFVKYIQVNTPTRTDGVNSREEIVTGIVNDFSNETVKKRFQLNEVRELDFQWIYFMNPENGLIIQKKGRTYDKVDALYTEVTNPSSANLIHIVPVDSSILEAVSSDGQDTATANQFGVIITENLCKELGYDPMTIRMIPMRVPEKNFVLLPVKAVVKSLPQFCDALITNEHSFALSNEIGETSWVSFAHGRMFSVISAGDSGTVRKLMEEVQDLKGTKSTIKQLNIDGSSKLNRYDYELPTYAIDKAALSTIIERLNGKNNRIYPGFYLNYMDSSRNLERAFAADFLEFRFNNLDSIKSFQKTCLDKYKMEADMQIINISNLFGEVGKISTFLGFGFIIFSMLMLLIFTNSFISRHIEDIKPNLGTLLAYGMPFKLINDTYLQLIFVIYLFALSVGIVLSLILSFVMILFEINFTWDIRIILFLIVIILFTLWYSKSVIAKIFNSTPGDLIYKR